MGAVDVGIGHDDDAAIAQIFVAIVRAGAATERLNEIGELLVLDELVLAGGSDIEEVTRAVRTSIGEVVVSVGTLAGQLKANVAGDVG